jgi:nucleoid-associated protein YgaU
MALNSKVAASTCLAFIFGMCWLVSLVARPMVELPSPLLPRGADADRGAVVVVRDTEDPRAEDGVGPVDVDVASRFARLSPVERSAEAYDPPGATVQFAALTPVTAEDAVPLAPPLLGTPPMLAASVEPTQPAGHLSPVAGSVETAPEPPIPVAVVSNLDERGTRLPAPASPTVDFTDPVEPAVAAISTVAWTERRREPARYTVREGDTVVKIMRRVWDSDDAQLMDLLLAANPDIAGRRNRIFPGEVLTIPSVSGPGEHVAAPVRTVAEEHAGQVRDRWYVVRQQDTLVRIARRILGDADRWREIAALNRLADADKIPVGLRLRLPPIVADT